jgi:hypothetical protein
MNTTVRNPFRPGAGHMPPYLAGRETERDEFARLLEQDTILENLVLTGLRGVGKTVLLETFKPMAMQKGWLWAGTDLSESSSVTEATLAIRLMTDLAVVTSALVTHTEIQPGVGFVPSQKRIQHSLDYAALNAVWQRTPGLASDKMKAVLELVWASLRPMNRKGIIFAYDEAQNLADHAERNEYPLSLLLDVFQSIQRKGLPFMLVLTGLPTLFPKLVEARTFSERMFHIVSLDRLSKQASHEAIVKPIEATDCPVHFTPQSVDSIYEITKGYPYFIQYVCRDVFDIWIQCAESGEQFSPIPIDDIMRKLDQDFFAGRWARATDRQRDLLGVIARLKNASTEFTVQEIVEESKKLNRPFTSSHVSQMLSALGEAGLVYKNRWGKYSLAVPLLDGFILRRLQEVIDGLQLRLDS